MAVPTSNIYTKGSLLGSDKEWYYGELSRFEAEQTLTNSGYDCFLIREGKGSLVLSLIHHGQVYHINIMYGPGWYKLESDSGQCNFTELDELITHYHSESIGNNLNITLGLVCEASRLENGKQLD